MAENNLTSLAVNSILIGVFVLGLVSCFVLLVNNEGRAEIFDDYPEINNYRLNLTSTYTDSQYLDTANVNLNLSAAYNPEIALSGADQTGNAISINLKDMIIITFTTIGLLGRILFGNVYTGVISGLVISILGYLIVSYIIKAIRSGDT